MTDMFLEKLEEEGPVELIDKEGSQRVWKQESVVLTLNREPTECVFTETPKSHMEGSLVPYMPLHIPGLRFSCICSEIYASIYSSIFKTSPPHCASATITKHAWF